MSNVKHMSKREQEPGEYGRNIEIHLTYFRHSQKTDARAGENGITHDVMLSQRGIKRAVEVGKQLKQEGRDPIVIGVTSLDRSGKDNNRITQTAKHILDGAEARDRLVRRWLTMGFYSKWYTASRFFFAKHNEVANRVRDEILRYEYQGKQLNELSHDEQERVMAIADEEGLKWYLSYEDRSPDDSRDAEQWYAAHPKETRKRTRTPREAAALAAYQINRLVNLPRYLKNGIKKDYLAVGNQWASEPFLIYALVGQVGDQINEQALNPVKKLSSMGGSLQILDRWDLKITTDDQGTKRVSLVFHNKTYRLDLQKIADLAKFAQTNIMMNDKDGKPEKTWKAIDISD